MRNKYFSKGFLYHVANTMCAVFVKGNFKAELMENYKKPEVTYEVNLKAKFIG